MIEYEFDHTLLRKKIKEKYGGVENLAEVINMCAMSLWRKLQNKTNFKTFEICNISAALDIPEQEIPIYFFKIQRRKS